MSAEQWITHLQLEPHPEGGLYRESYRAGSGLALPGRWGGPRPYSTAIYYLLRHGECSTLHRLRSDEVWHFYAGDPLTVHTLDETGTRRDLIVGNQLSEGQRPQAVVPARIWFGASVARGPEGFALVGCTVSPGFSFEDFEQADRETLIAKMPQHAGLITRLTNPT